MFQKAFAGERRPLRNTIATALFLAFQSSAVLAVPVDVAAQPLGSALRSLASQAGVQIAHASDVVGKLQATPIKGDMSLEEALHRLLVGTGLEFRKDGANSYVIVRAGHSEKVLPEMVVTATRTERAMDEVPASVSVISSEELRRLHLDRVEDALKRVEGIDFNTSAASPFGSSPMIRGIGGSYAGVTSSVLIDGMATDSAISTIAGRGGLDFLAPQDIERIEVVRGPASALYGSNVVGGVVNAIPARWRGDTGGEAHAEFGSHDTQKLGAIVGTANDRFDVRLSVYDAQSDGFKAKPKPDPWGGQDVRKRSWTDRKWNLNGAFRPTDDQEIGFSYQQYRTKQDYVGGDTFINSERREGDAYTLSYLKDFSDTASLKLKYRHLNLLQDWIDSDMGMGVGYRKSASDNLDAQLDLRLSAQNTLIVGASYQSADFKTVYISDNYRTTATADSYGVFVQDEHRFGDLTAVLGGRFDRFSQGASHADGVTVHRGTKEDVFSPRLGLRYRLTPMASLYASVGTAFMPANADMKYRGGSSRWQDNPGLKPEKSITYEIGINLKPAWGDLRSAVFHTDYRDMISTMSVGATPWPRQYVNIGKVEVDGFEFAVEGNLDGRWRPYANYAYTRSIIKENPSAPQTVGKQVQRIAPHKFNFGVTYAPADAWSASFGGRYVSERYFTDNNTADRKADAYFVADAKLVVELPAFANARWSAYLAVNNVFDKKYTVWEYEYADGRSAWLGLNARF